MNTPISFEISKVLKEKGFDNPTLQWYHRDTKKLNTNDLMFSMNKLTDNYSAPTIAETVMWLFEKHEIWISVDWMKRIKPYNSGFYCHLRGTNKSLNQDNFIVVNDTLDPGYEVFNSPKEAYSAGIEYILKNLIK